MIRWNYIFEDEDRIEFWNQKTIENMRRIQYKEKNLNAVYDQHEYHNIEIWVAIETLSINIHSCFLRRLLIAFIMEHIYVTKGNNNY